MVDQTFSGHFYAAVIKAAIQERARFYEELSSLLTSATFGLNFPKLSQALTHSEIPRCRPYTEIVGFYRFHFRQRG